MRIGISCRYHRVFGFLGRALAGLALVALSTPATAQDDAFHSLDSVRVGEPSSLDAVPNSEPSSLDAVPASEPSSLDAVRVGEALSPDDVPTAKPANWMTLPGAESESLDAAEAPESAGAETGTQATALSPHLREAFAKAQKAVTAGRARLEAANSAYSSMMARNYPRGEAKTTIVAERDAARAAYAQAVARFGDLGGQAPAAQAER